MKTLQEYKDWFATARPGDIFVYHEGTHLFDLQAQKRQVAVQAWRDSQHGLVFLSQKRRGVLFQYRAMKTNARLRKHIASWRKEDA